MTDDKKRWLVMGFNSYGRENYVVAECATEDEAKRLMAAKQQEPNADHMWVAKDES
jgi:hypothetical protein